jgi:transcriptional regulator with XRE-family HTH domain
MNSYKNFSVYPNCPKKIGRRFKSCRKKVMLTQKAIEEMYSGFISTGTVSRAENGHVYEIAYGYLEIIAKAIDVSLDYLLCRTDKLKTYAGGPYLY